jgi:tripartite ATP-independent transporter DctM subunit
MSGTATALLFTALMLAMMGLRVPIAAAMAIAGGLGYATLSGSFSPLLAHLKNAPHVQLSRDGLAVIPLFLLMGAFAGRAGISAALFSFANACLGHRRGGLGVAAIASCAMFGAICGSSLATAATMGRVALPQMRRYGYTDALATGTLAAGGSLGILIPPSIVLVVYAILTEQNIARLFLAALIPGLMAVIGYMIAIAVHTRLHPGSGPAGARTDWSGRLKAMRDTLPMLALFVMVIGGIYGGVFTPTEAAAFGAAGAALIGVTLGGMRLDGIIASLLETAMGTAMIFMILIGADIFNSFLALSGLPRVMAEAIGGAGFPPLAVLIAMLAMYLLLGCLMDSLSMILLTVPIVFPVVMGLDFGMSPEHTAIWFGIIILIVVEIGLITPPIGLNVFIINRLAGDVPMSVTFRGVAPFLISDLVRVAILVAFPVLSVGILRFV